LNIDPLMMSRRSPHGVRDAVSAIKYAAKNSIRFQKGELRRLIMLPFKRGQTRLGSARLGDGLTSLRLAALASRHATTDDERIEHRKEHS